MRRREFIGTLSLAAFAAPHAAWAQPPGRVFRIGILANLRPAASEAGGRLWPAFIQGLLELGYVEGKNITIEWQVSEGRYELLPGLAAELVRRDVDVIVVPADQNAFAAKQATLAIPIVMIGDPVGSGLVASLARPGANITGLSNVVGPEIAGKQVELLKAMVPQVSRIAILSNPGNPQHTGMLREVGIVARSLGVQVQTLQARGPDDFGRAFTAITKEDAGAVLILGDGMFTLHTGQIADLAVKTRVPTMGSRDLVNTGGLMSYGPSSPELWRRAAIYVDKIIKGAKPADLPVEQPTKYELVINLKTAKALGLTIPQSILLRADEVIE
jgi:putative ABC transport system substrate-binding protein